MMTQQYRIEVLDFEQITPDKEIQVRAVTSQETIQEYFEAMETEEDMKRFPQMTVYFDNGFYRLADGHHRYWAIKRRGYKKVTVKVVDGSRDDAIFAAVKMNTQNGLRFNDNDWKKIILLITSKAQWKNWANRRLAKELGCSENTIRRYRHDSSGAPGGAPEKRQGKDGKTYPAQMNKKAKPKNAATEASATSKTDTNKKKTAPHPVEPAHANPSEKETMQANPSQAETAQAETVQIEPSQAESPQAKSQKLTIEEAKAAGESIFEMIDDLGQKITNWLDSAPSELHEDFVERLLKRFDVLTR
jgi:ParB-like chromosome segregation protein Spo0J